MLPDIADRRCKLALREGTLAPYDLAAKAEPAIGSADMNRLEQHPVRIAMHHPRDRTVPAVSDRIRHLFRALIKLCRRGDELPRNGVNGIVRSSEFRKIGCERQRISARDRRNARKLLLSNDAGVQKVSGM